MPFFIVWLVAALTQQSPVIQNLTEEKLTIAHYAYNSAVEAGIDAGKFVRLIECESKYDKKTPGDNGDSYGILQFQKPTFDHFAKDIYGATNLNYKSEYDQISLAAMMIRDGHISRWWNCAHTAYVGYYKKEIVKK